MEPFKNIFNPVLVQDMAAHFARHHPDFNQQGFITDATHNFETLELKDRSSQIAAAMQTHLHDDFEQTAALLRASLEQNPPDDLKDAQISDHGIAGWAVMPMAHYVGLHGFDHFDTAMHLFKELTKRFTSEFAVRSFLLQDQERTMAYLMKWAEDENRHVRRLASEGCRPRLPWAPQLPQLIAEPTPLLPLLEKLKDDPEPYVRKSVANNLNDIAKDHPRVVTAIAEQWLKGASSERERLVRHACRTLIKQGDQKLLSVLGYRKPQLKIKQLKLGKAEVYFGGALPFALSLTSTSKQEQPLIIDYIIHHQKAGGHTTPKVFKWKTFTLKGQETVNLKKKHPFKKITTRVYYPGRHALEILINGESYIKQDFELLM